MAKFDWVPYFQGKGFNYYQWFSLVGSTSVFIAFVVFQVVYLALGHLENIRLQYDKGQGKYQTLHKWKTYAFSISFVALSCIPLICAAMDVTYFVVGVLGMWAILTLMLILNNGRQKWHKENMNRSSRPKNSISRVFWALSTQVSSKLKIKIFIVFAISLFLNMLFYRTCFCFYNTQIFFYSKKLGYGINTYASRLVQLQPSCPPGPPCHVYTTFPQNPEQAFFLNFHTHVDVKQAIVSYRQLQNPKSLVKNVTAYSFEYEGLQKKTARAMHTALIMDLKPNTKYQVQIFYNNKYWKKAVYRTLPSDPSIPIRMINAGDAGYTEASRNMSRHIGKLQPHVFFMGGDLAYDDNMPACSYTWDTYFKFYQIMTDQLGYLMPMIVTVGNHDAGVNQLPGINITINHQGPGFLIYFPQHYDRDENFAIKKVVPPVKNRRTVMNFTFSNVHYVLLDSGYLHNFHGWQKKFMIDSFEANRDKIKFVNYHVPIYSVCQTLDNNPERYLYALFHWIPTFDHYKVMTSFENHVHSFKRTKPLIGNQPAKKGTVYLGDGAFGAIVLDNCTPDKTIQVFEKISKSNNFWMSDIYSDRVEHFAYDQKGVLLDNFTQIIKDYQLGPKDASQTINQKHTQSLKQDVKKQKDAKSTEQL